MGKSKDITVDMYLSILSFLLTKTLKDMNSNKYGKTEQLTKKTYFWSVFQC